MKEVLSRFLRLRKIFIFVISSELLGLFILAMNGPRLVWDEGYHLKTVPLVFKYGLSKEFFLRFPGPIGPLYSWIHALFSPITSLSLPGIRVLNYCFLLVLIASIYFLLRYNKNPAAYLIALCIMGLPPIYVISGMALTDIPPLAFVSIGILFMVISSKHNDINSWIFSVLSGISFSLAILGRQTYAVFAFMLIFYAVIDFKLAGKLILIFFLSVIPFACEVYIWKGLVPPQSSYVSHGINLTSFILSFFYIGTFMLILSPGWFTKKLLAISIFLLIGFIINLRYSLIVLTPMRTLAKYMFTPSLLSWYTKIISAMILGSGSFIFYTFIAKIREYRTDKFSLYLISITLCSVLSTVTITHQFHSKYIIQTIPCLILLIAPDMKITKWLIARISLGGLIGLAMLYSYLFLKP